MFRKYRGVLIVMAVLIIASAAYSFAAANTVPATKAGDGLGAVTGYTVTNIVYVLNADPSKISSVTFDLSAAALQVQVRLDSTGGAAWYACTNSAANSWSCNTANVATTGVNQFQVVAYSN